MKDLITDLVSLSKELEGLRPSLNQISISALVNQDSFLLNSVETNSRQITKGDIYEYRLEPVLNILNSEYLSNSKILEIIKSSQESKGSPKASTETLIHALCLKYGEAKYVAHSHSLTVNKILCSQIGSTAFKGHVFADSITACGKTPATISFVEAGFFQAKAVYNELKSFKKINFQTPKILLMENHGPIALAKNPKELVNIIKTLEQWAELLLAGYQLSGPNYLSLDHVLNIEAEHRKMQK